MPAAAVENNFFILSLIPVVNFVASMILAFDGSKPVAATPPDTPA